MSPPWPLNRLVQFLQNLRAISHVAGRYLLLRTRTRVVTITADAHHRIDVQSSGGCRDPRLGLLGRRKCPHAYNQVWEGGGNRSGLFYGCVQTDQRCHAARVTS